MIVRIAVAALVLVQYVIQLDDLGMYSEGRIHYCTVTQIVRGALRLLDSCMGGYSQNLLQNKTYGIHIYIRRLYSTLPYWHCTVPYRLADTYAFLVAQYGNNKQYLVLGFRFD